VTHLSTADFEAVERLPTDEKYVLGPELALRGGALEGRDELFATTQCWLARHHGGARIDVHREFNGANGSRPAERFLASDYTHPARKGTAGSPSSCWRQALQSGFRSAKG
jgi:hypothetical protein